ncbi:MAG: CPXCG motif-containing cysteine-rich protein [Bdellovibrionota bacterium]|nr:CPXCG motif-containing cysteine-rich protein [Bdellovibrionota bacterium]
MFGEIEHSFFCPYCNSPISIVLEALYGKQTYIEDCEVCCSPIEIDYKFDEEFNLIFFESRKA